MALDDRAVRLNNGVWMPRVGLGVFQAAAGDEARDAVREALRVGYRHVDTARIYGNERDVGAAIRESGIPREEVFVTTKLWNDDHGYDDALRAFDRSAGKLDLGAVDLYLIHWPTESSRRLDAWRALERLYEEKRVRAIGVSNYMPNHLEELFAHARVPPAVNQIEVSPFLQQREVRAVCERHGIVVQAYSPLTRGKFLRDPRLAAVARRVGRTPAQVLLRWGLQHGLVVLPKSVRPERIAENFSVFDFELPRDDMAELDALERGYATGWDPRGRP
jgi:diketogulonate reductase-like aldo/keto reductase